MEGLFYDYLEFFLNKEGELEFEIKEVQITDLDPIVFFPKN